MEFIHHKKGDMAYLPQEIFQMIIMHLEPVDLVRCRRVSPAWYRAFTNPVNLMQLLKQSYPSAREVRRYFQQPEIPVSNGEIEGRTWETWRSIFDTVTERYYRLDHGMPRSMQKFDLCTDEDAGNVREKYQYFSVPSWDNHSSHSGNRIDMLFEHAFWTYEDGLVVFPDRHEQCLMLLDLSTEEKFMIPFVTTDKVLRRLRLNDRLLVIEWAECEAFHWLNDRDRVHRHYATSFEVNEAGRGWDIMLRNEWKIMFLGHPLGERDRFYSTHSRTHYAIYVWQPNRSLYTAEEDAPIESLSIWDISEPSRYRPSQDPTGQLKDTMGDTDPFIVARFAFRELDFHSVRQRGSPAIVRMDIDSSSNSISITEVRDAGRVDYNTLEYAPKAQVITIPFIGQGPSWHREVQVLYPPYRGNCSMELSPWTVTSPWPCYWAICESTDAEAHVSFCISYLSSMTQAGYQVDPLMVTIHTPQAIVTLRHELAKELSYKGKICGDERFVVGENSENQLVVLNF